MKTFGCIFAIVGVVLCLVSFAVFGTEIFNAMKAHEVMTIPLALGEKVNTQTIQVDTLKLCSIAVRAKVRSDHAARGTGSDAGYEIQYRFPFHYSVYDSEGKVLISEGDQFSWNSGFRTTSNREVSQQGGTTDVERDYKKFKVSAPGTIRVEAEIGPDTVYNAQANDLALIVYDNVSEHAKSVITGVVMLLAGGVMSFVGFVVFLVGLVQGKPAQPGR